MRTFATAAALAAAITLPALAQEDMSAALQSDWDGHLRPLYEHFHANPELSFMEVETAARLASELRDAGYEVTGRRMSGAPVWWR